LSKLRPYKFRELVRKLRAYDPLFEVHVREGKGSHRMLYHPNVDGRAEAYPLKCHGENTEIAVCYIRNIIRRFKLPEGVL
jgi:hypothetical protein